MFLVWDQADSPAYNHLFLLETWAILFPQIILGELLDKLDWVTPTL